MNRRELLIGGGSAGAFALVGCASGLGVVRAPAEASLSAVGLTAAQYERGARFLAENPSIDVHAHPGRFFVANDPDPTPLMKRLFPAEPGPAIQALHEGQVSAALFAAVADKRLLGSSEGVGLVATRNFRPGEAWEDYRRQISVARDLLEDPKLTLALSAGDILDSIRNGTTAMIMSVEGGDFIEDRIERIALARKDGVCSITIVHYTNNLIGDIQTDPRSPGGLTSFGRDVVNEMQRVGILIDLAHASPRTVRDTVAMANRPMMISHSNLETAEFSHPRLIDKDTARSLAGTGGIIGSVPSGLGQVRFGEWIDSIELLVATVGIDHVGIGTDMDANFRPVFNDYRLWPAIPGALLARGMSEVNCAKIMGGNFLRIFSEAV